MILKRVFRPLFVCGVFLGCGGAGGFAVFFSTPLLPMI